MPIYNGADEVRELYCGADQVMAMYNGPNSILPTPYVMTTVNELGYNNQIPVGTLTPNTFRGFTISGILWYGAFRIAIPGAQTPTLWSQFTLVNSAGTAVMDEPVSAFTFFYQSGFNLWQIASPQSPFPTGAASWKVYFHE